MAMCVLCGTMAVPPARAADGARGIAERAGEKLVRGVVNLGTGWAEILKQPYLIGKHEGWRAGALRGPIEGLGMVFVRTIGGAFEILTFPLPIPSGYQPMVEPDYVWQEDTAASGRGSGAAPLGGGEGTQEGEAEGF